MTITIEFLVLAGNSKGTNGMARYMGKISYLAPLILAFYSLAQIFVAVKVEV